MTVGVLVKQDAGRSGEGILMQELTRRLLDHPAFEPVPFTIADRPYPLSVSVQRLRLQHTIQEAGQEHDAVFIPGQRWCMADPADVDAPVVPFVHDVLQATTTFSPSIPWLLARRYTRYIEQCQTVICASDATKQDILYRTRFTGDAYIGYNGIEMPTVETPLETEYTAVWVGTPTPRKDMETAETVFRRIHEQGGRCAVVTSGEFDAPADQYTDISTQKLARLYAAAEYYFHPSRAEGFGRPPVEAQCYGTVPVARPLPVNEDVLGDAWYPFTSVDEAVDRLLSPPSQDVQTRAQENAERFDWDETAAKVRRILLAAADGETPDRHPEADVH